MVNPVIYFLSTFLGKAPLMKVIMNLKNIWIPVWVMANVIVGMCANGAGTVGAATITIYQDSFSRGTVGTPLTLNGTAPDVVNTGGATWTGGASDTTDGTQANNPAGAAGFLPFTPASGNIYTLSADLDLLAANDQWEAIGFTNGTNSGNEFYLLGNNAGPWLLQRGDGVTLDHTFLGPETSGGAAATASGVTGYNTYSIVLDTTNAAWTAAFYRGATLLVGPTAYGVNPTISAVGFGNSNSAGNIDNFTLTVTTIPEPAAVTLLGFGGVGLMAVARRRNAQARRRSIECMPRKRHVR
jgi:hypothetical protein